MPETPISKWLRWLPSRWTTFSKRQRGAPEHSSEDRSENSRAEISAALESAYEERAERTADSGDSAELDSRILELRRRLREGGVLRHGDLLADGRFKLLEPLGAGGFARVWRCYDRQRHEIVATKVLHGQYARDRTRRERFFRGARTMARLQHHGVVRVVEEQLEEDGFCFYVTEYVAGTDLRQAVLEAKLGPEEKLQALVEIAEVLDFAHRQGVIHRDVKPANILLGEGGEIKLTDFDLVRAANTTGGTRTGMLGTVVYAAPEMMTHAADADERSDVYSLGMTAAFVLQGADLPFEVLKEASVFVRRMDVGRELRHVVAKAVAWRPEDRWSSAGELADALRCQDASQIPVAQAPQRAATSTPSTHDSSSDMSLATWPTSTAAFHRRGPFRLGVAAVFFGLWFLATIARLYYLQIVKHELYAERASSQQLAHFVVDSNRGYIFDARRRPLAVSAWVESIAADPSQIEDVEATADALASSLGEDSRAIAAKLTKDSYFVWIARKSEPELAEQVEALNLPGVFTLTETKRYYPMEQLAAALGFVGTDNNGLAGLEYRYDSSLRGESGLRTVVRDGNFRYRSVPSANSRDSTHGSDLHLTLHAAIQNTVRRELATAVERHGARTGTAVMLEPGTGAVLAMATYPTFDAENFSETSQDLWRNRPVGDLFEPGEVLSAFVVAAALESGQVKLDSLVDCGDSRLQLGSWQIEDQTCRGMLTPAEILVRASSLGVLRLTADSTQQALHQHLTNFGFGRQTGIDLPGEAAGLLRPWKDWSEEEKLRIAIGQGVAVSGVQLVRGFAAFANGGLLPTPHLVAAIGSGADRRQIAPGQSGATRVLNPVTASQLRGILAEAVDRGPHGAAAVPGYRVGGFGGTAVVHRQPGDTPTRLTSSFVGFAPAHDPAIVCGVFLDLPNTAEYAEPRQSAETFSAIVSETLLYLGVSP